MTSEAELLLPLPFYTGSKCAVEDFAPLAKSVSSQAAAQYPGDEVDG